MLEKDHTVDFDQPGADCVDVTVCISLYNYEAYIEETLKTVHDQTLASFDCIVLNDCSTDRSAETVKAFFHEVSHRFNRCQLISHCANEGLSAARNTAINLAKTPYIFVLDADNLIYPRCLARLIETALETDAPMVYPIIEDFGAKTGLRGFQVWHPSLFEGKNHVDAMTLLRKSAWHAVGGYTPMFKGLEDYDFWLKFIKHDLYGIQVPEILARYRVHPNSMYRTVTALEENQKEIRRDLQRRHPWADVGLREG